MANNQPNPAESFSVTQFAKLLDDIPITARPYRRFKEALDQIGEKLAEKWDEGADRKKLVALVQQEFGYSITEQSLRRHLKPWLRKFSENRKQRRRDEVATKATSGPTVNPVQAQPK